MRIYKNPLKENSGMTLIEIMIVITIIAIIFSIGASRLSRNFGSPIKQATRQIVLLTKLLHSNAKLKNRTYRIVIEFPDKVKNTRGKLYVESGASTQLADKDVYETFKKKSRFEEPPPSPFSPDSSMMKKPFQLPGDVEFQSVEIENINRPITEGKAYIHFFPQGLIEKSIIHIGDGQNRQISLIINPLTGRTDVENSLITMKDLDK